MVILLLLMALSAAGAAVDAAGPAGTVAGHPNVLLITIDDLSTDLSIYGNRQVSTPNFERLAKRALRFDRAYSQFGSCNGSRTSMLTGLRPDSTGVVNNEVFFRTLLPDVVSLPQFFRRRGYVTMNLGKTFHGAGNKGWDDPEAWDISLFPSGRRRGREGGEGRNVTGGALSWTRWRAALGKDADQADGRTARSAASALKALYTEARPFFLAVGFRKPHSPYVAPKRDFDRYKPSRIELREPPEIRSAELEPAITEAHAGALLEMSRRDKRELLRGYYACVTFIDRQLGRVLDAVDRADGWKNTIIVVTSDHGVHLGEHDWWGKSTVFEPSVHVPLLIHAPGNEAKRKHTARLVELLDVYPTLVDLANLKASTHLQGKSLAPLLERPRSDWSAAAFSQAHRSSFKGESVRTPRWRYTEWNGGDDGVELYDHFDDPGEYLNLAELPEYEAVIEELRSLLDSNFED